jgi:ABC-2 type transport system permease protein
VQVGWKDKLAYRTELLVWMVSMTLPIVMLALFRAVAAEGAVGPFDAQSFTAYFLAVLVVRQISGSWVAWEIEGDVRSGTLSVRLLRPIHPLWSYLCSSTAEIPLRAMISLPLSIFMLYAIEGTARVHVVRDPASIAMALVSLALCFLVSFAVSALIGTLSLFFESVTGVWMLFSTIFAAVSGYVIPIALFPSWLRTVLAYTPFPYMLSTPVEIITGMRQAGDALHAIGAQAICAVLLVGLLLLEWHSALKRHAAFGG